VGIAQTQNSQTPEALSKEYARVVLDPSRDQDWARFPGRYALATQSTIIRYGLSLITAWKFNRGERGSPGRLSEPNIVTSGTADPAQS
jgi:hypothetical protein